MPRAECWVHGGVRAALRAGRVLGLAPVRIEEYASRTDRISVSAAWVLYGKVLNVVIGMLSIILTGRLAYEGFVKYSPQFSGSGTWYITMMLEVISSSLLAGAAGVDGAHRMDRFINTMKKIQTINFINSTKKSTRDSFGEHWVWLMIIWACALQGSSLTLIILALGETAVHVVTCAVLFMPFFMKVFISLQYVCLMSALNSSLLALYNFLNEVAVELSLKEDYDNAVYKKAYEAVKSANCSYLSIYDLVKKFNKQDGVLMLLLFGATIIRTLRCFYLFLFALNTHATDSSTDTLSIVIGMVSIIFEITQIVLLIETCYRTTEMLNSLRYLVSECLVNASPGGVLAEELTIFQESLGITPVSFSPLDICTFSRPVMIGILSFYVTAATVMRQFNLKI